MYPSQPHHLALRGVILSFLKFPLLQSRMIIVHVPQRMFFCPLLLHVINLLSPLCRSSLTHRIWWVIWILHLPRRLFSSLLIRRAPWIPSLPRLTFPFQPLRCVAHILPLPLPRLMFPCQPPWCVMHILPSLSPRLMLPFQSAPPILPWRTCPFWRWRPHRRYLLEGFHLFPLLLTFRCRRVLRVILRLLPFTVRRRRVLRVVLRILPLVALQPGGRIGPVTRRANMCPSKYPLHSATSCTRRPRSVRSVSG